MHRARSKDDLYRDQWLRPHTPPFAVSNEELVAAFNQYVDLYNEENASAIDAGQLSAKQHSSCEFIEKASGIKSRYLVSREGVLNPDIMQPLLAERPDEMPSIMVEMAVAAAEQALIAAGREPGRSIWSSSQHPTCRAPIRHWPSSCSTIWGRAAWPLT